MDIIRALRPSPNSSNTPSPNAGYSTPPDYWSTLNRCGPPTNRAWWKEIVCYQVWPRSFKDSGFTNIKGHGDILGVLSKLDYIASLGVDVLWLCPTYSSPQKDAGYDISDYEGIDPDFGTMAQMEELIADLCSYNYLAGTGTGDLLILESSISPNVTLTCSYVDLAPYEGCFGGSRETRRLS